MTSGATSTTELLMRAVWIAAETPAEVPPYTTMSKIDSDCSPEGAAAAGRENGGASHDKQEGTRCGRGTKVWPFDTARSRFLVLRRQQHDSLQSTVMAQDYRRTET